MVSQGTYFLRSRHTSCGCPVFCGGADDAYPPARFSSAETPEQVTVVTDRLRVEIGRQGGRVRVQEREHRRVVLDDGEDGGPGWDSEDGSAAWFKRMPADEHYYGFGERTGLLDKRGRRYTCWTTDEYAHQGPGTDALYQAIPFFLALDGTGRCYGVFLNNTFRTAFDFTAVRQGTWWMEVAGGELDYYLIYGPEPAQVVARYTELTGRMPLPPKWALGYQQSRWSYESDAVVRELAAEFRRHCIPCDVIYLSPELFARWMQLGVLYPFARASSAKGCASNEPWAWGEEVEQISRRVIELRYRLLPYLYTLFEEATRSGAPILRPLFYHYPADTATHLLHDQALLGRDLMLAPILRPGKVCREVYVPTGLWYDLRSGKRLSGPQHVLAAADLAMPMPLYARGGAVIPSGPVLAWADERPLAPLTVDIYPDEDGAAEGMLYEDDGVSFAYEQGICCHTTYQCHVDRINGVSVLRARLFGIDANNWGADLEKDLALATKITKLPIAIWVVGRSNRLTVRPQRVLALPQQPRHGCSANLEALSLQLVTQFSERFARPLQPRQWVTGGGIFQELVEHRQDSGIFFSICLRRRPGWRMPLERWETEPWSSSRPRRMVVRLNPVISAKRVIPPRPCLKAKRPATWRRAFSSRVASSRLIA